MKHIHKNYIGMFIGFFSIIILSSLMFTNNASAAGLSIGDSQVKNYFATYDDVFEFITGQNSFSKIITDASNTQNQIKGQSHAVATVRVDYAVTVYEKVTDNQGNITIKPSTPISEEKALMFTTDNLESITPNHLKNLFERKIVGEIIAQNYPDQTEYAVTIRLISAYNQQQLVKITETTIENKPLNLQGNEKIIINLVQEGSGLTPIGTKIINLQVNGPNSFHVNASYGNSLSGSTSATWSAATSQIVTSGTLELPITLDPNTRRIYQTALPGDVLYLNYGSSVMRGQTFSPDNGYLSTGVDPTLGDGINRLYNSFANPDLTGFPETLSSENSSSLSSQKASSYFSSQEISSNTSSKLSSIPSAPFSTTSSSSISSSSSSTISSSSTTTGGSLFGSTDGNLSSLLNSDPTADTLFTQKTALGNLASDLFTDADVEEAIGGGMDISKWADNNTDVLALGNLDGTESGKSLKDTLFSKNWLVAIILGFLTIVLIIISVPLAWKFIKKGSNDDLIR